MGSYTKARFLVARDYRDTSFPKPVSSKPLEGVTHPSGNQESEIFVALNWGEFAKTVPEMAIFGEERLKSGVAYLATIGPDSYPRVHPFTPFVGSGHLFAFMYSTSPKGKDLRRNHKYAIHSLVNDMNGSNGEFLIKGDALLIEDTAMRKEAMTACPYAREGYPEENALLFEFKITRCLTNYYEGGNANAKHWSETQK